MLQVYSFRNLPVSKYTPLKHRLEGTADTETAMSFAQVEDILGFGLPPSARKHQAWWANTGGTHVHAAAWLDAGWRTSRVDVAGERVVFIRDADAASGVSEGPPEGFFMPFEALQPVTRRLLEDYCEATGGDPQAAAVAILNAAALERRRTLLDRFAQASPRLPNDSAPLIREDRDGR